MTQPSPPSSPSGPLAPQPAGWNQPGPQPGGGWNQPVPAPAKKPSKAPKVLIILGAVVLALSLVAGIVLAILGFSGATSDLEVISGAGSIEVEAGEVVQLYAEEGTPTPLCMVTGPSASALGDGTAQDSTITTEGRTWVSFDSFTANEAGQYEFDCAGDEIAVGPPVSAGSLLTGIGGIFLAIVGGALGILLLVIGVIILLVRRSRA